MEQRVKRLLSFSERDWLVGMQRFVGMDRDKQDDPVARL
jgi:hypothetical protein